MNFVVDNGPHIKDQDNTSKIMKRVVIALLPIIFFSFYKNGIIPYMKGYISFFTAFRPLLMIILAMITTLLSEALYVKLILRKSGINFKSYMSHSYSLLPGLFLALTLPINTPLWVLVIGAVIASIVGKMFFGGFGHNIFNPALIGVLFITGAYSNLITSRGGYLNGMELDTISSSTPLSHLHNLNFVGTWDKVGSTFGSLWDYFLGFIPGSLGETSKLLILVAMIYLIITKVIKWRVPVTYISTVFIMTLGIGLISNQGIWFSLFQILSGSLIFGAVFIATDPVTSPVTKTGTFLYGLSLGILTVVFRFLTPYPEGVLTSVLTMNMLVFVLDKIGAISKFDPRKMIIPIGVLLCIMFILTIYIGNDIKPKPADKQVNIIDVKKNDKITTYDVTTKGFHGLIEATVTFDTNRLTTIDIIKEQETYWSEIVTNNYINKLIGGQDNIDNVDTVSGATVSSSALKEMVKEVLKNHRSSR